MPSLVLDRRVEEEFKRLLGQLAVAGQKIESERVLEAWQWAIQLYGDRQHSSGQSLLSHAVAVLERLLAFRPDEEAVIACLLQHVIDVEEQGLEQVQKRFGLRVKTMISGVHLLSHVSANNRRMSMDHLRLMFLQVSDDMRVILIALCAQSCLLDRLSAFPPDERRRISQDCLTLYAPVAARLGIYSLKHSFEARAFPIAYPTDSEHILQQVQDIHRQYGDFLEGAVQRMEAFLGENGIPARVEAREKQAYSIFRKMQDKSISHVSELYDLFALRVIVRDEATCYQTLGLLHRIGLPVPQRFKDYIAFRKPNGYQSLHTTLMKVPGMPEHLRIEVQIRTEAMHREAEFGIAAHWSYKEGGQSSSKEQLSRARAFQQAIEKGKENALGSSMFVLTPKGEIIDLPEGATPLDFAFQVHTDLGISFRSARVNGHVVPMTRQLENGDIVEIQRYREPRPSPRWAMLLKTAAARSHLKKYLAKRQTSLDLPVTAKPKEESKKKHAAKILPQSSVATVVSEIPMPIRFAKCCKADATKKGAIVGIVSRSGNVHIHRAACTLIKKGNPGRRVKVKWA